MPQITRPVRTRFQPGFLLLLLVAFLATVGVYQKFGFNRSAHANTTAAFTPGNLVIYRVGNGAGSLLTTGNPVFLDEYTPAGALVQSIAVPTTTVASNRRLVANGTSTSEGLLTRSADGNYLILTGYDSAIPAGAGLNTTASATTNRVIGRVDASGNIDTTTALVDAADAGNPRSATSTNGTDLWIAGSTGGIRYTTLGATTSTQLSTTVTNLRQAAIFGGQLYVSDSSGTAVRIGTVGSGAPTTSGQTITNLPGFPTAGSPYNFFFADLDGSVAGFDTLYVAEDTTGTGQIQKYALVGGNWVAKGTITAAGIRGLIGSVSASTVTLFGTTGASAAAGGGSLYTLVDASGYNATITGTLTTIATAGTNTAFRGVAFAPATASPSPSPSPAGSPTLSINDVTQAETNSGQTAFNFTVSLDAPAGAGGVTFDASTADGTTNPANAPGDYDALTNQPFSISAGNNSTTVTVMVNGDLTTEANETFFVNITNVVGATAGDVQGLGTITNDDISLTPIHNIQGSGSTSPLVSTSVTTTGIVTGLKSNGFFIQEPDAGADADPNTSEGIFVFTSSAPPGAAVIGNSVQVTGTVQEFIPGADPNSPPTTELITPTVVLLSSGNPLPAAITITAAETTQPSETTNPMDSLEEYEGMRVTVPSLTVTGPSQGTINEPNATVASTGVFLGVVTGVARPIREPGIAISDPVPAPNPPNVPRFDENPERIRVDSDAQPGTTAIDVAAGTVITNITGPLDYAFRCYTIDPDAATPPVVGAQPGSTPVPAATADEFTVASFNMERFFNTVNDGTGDPVLTVAAFNRRVAKASLIIRTVQRYPDVIGVEEMENLTTLHTVAAQINSDAVTLDALPNPNYQAFLVEGNDVGGIDVGFLVKTSRFNVIDVTQFGKATTYINPNNGQPELLNDRPPLVLRGYIQRTPPGTFTAFTVIVNHLRSLSAIDDATDGNRVRTKRNEQAKFLANLIQARQVADPNEKIITVGDMNAFRVNDGYVDVIGTVLGTPAPADQVVLSSPDLVNPNQTDLVDTLTAAQQYSYNFDGNAQTLDHVIVNPPALAILNRFAYARDDSDFAVKNYESTNELRISDHDQPVAYFSLSAPTAANGAISGRVTDSHGAPVPGSVVQLSGAQTRKTITDADGNYRFDNVETNGFYTVTPTRANFVFSPGNRSFSQTGNKTEAAFTGSSNGDSANPLDTAEYFVRQQYVDLLAREPDEGGFNYWSDQINQCGVDAGCVSTQRRAVAAAFFVEREFQSTGSFIYDLYAGALGRQPAFVEYSADRQQVVGGANLEAERAAFAASFVQRPEFLLKYQTQTTAASFVGALIDNALAMGLDMSGQRANLINVYNDGSNTVDSRALVMRALADDASFRESQYNKAFVLTEYFAYLRRDPDPNGYNFWLNVLDNNERGNYGGMVCAFINSTEYQRRFSEVVSRNDSTCR